MMIKQIKKTTAITLFLLAILIIPNASTAAGGYGNPFRDETLKDIQGNTGNRPYYRSHSQQNKKKKRRRSSRSKKQRSVSPLITEGIQVQKALRSLGYYDSTLDGKLDSYPSRVAIMLYQKHYGLPETGELIVDVQEVLLEQGENHELSNYLASDPDSQDQKARRLQAALTVQGFYSSSIDGIFGSESRSAMRLYQEASGLVPSGALLPEQEQKLVTDSAQLLQDEQSMHEQTLVNIAAQSQPQFESAVTQNEDNKKSDTSKSISSITTIERSQHSPEPTTEDLAVGVSTVSEETVLKADASISSETLQWLSAGTGLTINATDGDWARVSVDGQEGYVFTEFLLMGNEVMLPENETVVDHSSIIPSLQKTGEAVVLEETVLKAGASASSETLQGLSVDTGLMVNAVDGDWAHVTVDGREGYVFADFLRSGIALELPGEGMKEEEISNIDTESPRSGAAVITEATVLKADKDTSSETLVGLLEGVELLVNSIEGDWAHVTVKDQQGYVYTQFLEMRVQ